MKLHCLKTNTPAWSSYITNLMSEHGNTYRNIHLRTVVDQRFMLEFQSHLIMNGGVSLISYL